MCNGSMPCGEAGRSSLCAARDDGYCYLKYSAEGSVAKDGATTCTVTVNGTCACTEGRDIQNAAGGATQTAATEGECCAACANDTQCKAAVYVGPG
eukprot:gene14186-63811_t